MYVEFISYSKHKHGNSTSSHKAKETDARHTSDIVELYGNSGSAWWNLVSLSTDDTFELNHRLDATLLILYSFDVGNKFGDCGSHTISLVSIILGRLSASSCVGVQVSKYITVPLTLNGMKSSSPSQSHLIPNKSSLSHGLSFRDMLLNRIWLGFIRECFISSVNNNA